ncbi:TPM domain-containing protein [Thermococcus stetteri]|uniref:TPM domain-containing protein n=1 Tax=Thermococcus stetteri TaxID=49900 RepID=UPI001AEAD6AD|nr:TPM domain-containing protein [Thermococcus stetteri]MBP1911754.1 hypothetical protein [Thermococcus stetteri]
MRRRGFVFTLDALLALFLVIIVMASVVTVTESKPYSTYLRSQSKYAAENILRVLQITPLSHLVPKEKIEEWETGSETEKVLYLDLVSPDMPVLDIIATYWATEPIYPNRHLRSKAEEIARYVLDRALKGYRYELIINNYTVPYIAGANANYSLASDVSSATIVLSGYKYNQTPRGYMARAYITKATVVREDLYGWFRVLAGADWGHNGPLNQLVIKRAITLPSDASIIYSDGKFVSRQGEYIDLYINGQHVAGEYNKIDIDHLEGYLHGGDNTVTLVFSHAKGNEIGSASGTTLYVKYRSNSLDVEDPGLVKVYDVTSKTTGMMYLFEMFVPGNITRINMHFKIKNVGNVNLYFGLGGNLVPLLTKSGNTNGDAVVDFTDNEIKAALRRIGITYDNLTKMVFDFVVGFDAYYKKGTWYYEGGDNYNDNANRERKVYGYPDSYVRIDYVPTAIVTEYSIPLSVYFPYGDSRVTYNGNGLQVTYSLPSYAEPWYADFWVGYQFWDYTTQQELWENGRMFYSGPLGRYAIRVAYTRLYDWMMVPGQQNTFEIRMTNGDSRVRDGETRGIIKYFIRGYVGYGDIFPYLMQGYPNYKGYNLTYYYTDGTGTYESTVKIGQPPYYSLSIYDLDPTKYAVDDAIFRLFERLGGKGTSDSPIEVRLPESVNIDFAPMGNIPGLFEPIQITLRVWREG